MVHVYKTGISESVFTDHRMLNSEIGICFTGKQSCYTIVMHAHIFVCHSSAEVVIVDGYSSQTSSLTLILAILFITYSRMILYASLFMM